MCALLGWLEAVHPRGDRSPSLKPGFSCLQVDQCFDAQQEQQNFEAVLGIRLPV